MREIVAGIAGALYLAENLRVEAVEMLRMHTARPQLDPTKHYRKHFHSGGRDTIRPPANNGNRAAHIAKTRSP